MEKELEGSCSQLTAVEQETQRDVTGRSPPAWRKLSIVMVPSPEGQAENKRMKTNV